MVKRSRRRFLQRSHQAWLKYRAVGFQAAGRSEKSSECMKVKDMEMNITRRLSVCIVLNITTTDGMAGRRKSRRSVPSFDVCKTVWNLLAQKNSPSPFACDFRPAHGGTRSAPCLHPRCKLQPRSCIQSCFLCRMVYTCMHDPSA